MPRLSESMEEGTILKWLVEEGGEVRKGEPLVEIETDKANMTYDAEADGTLAEILAKEGDTLYAVETPQGYLVTPFDPKFAKTMEAAERVFRRNRNAYKELSKR